MKQLFLSKPKEVELIDGFKGKVYEKDNRVYIYGNDGENSFANVARTEKQCKEYLKFTLGL